MIASIRMGMALGVVGLVACGPVPPKAPDAVPPDLVLPGFSQSECHFKAGWKAAEESSGPASQFGGAMANAKSADSQHRVTPPVVCHKSVDPPPTSGTPQALCGSSNGTLLVCEGG
jgi:hypothetical protein